MPDTAWCEDHDGPDSACDCALVARSMWEQLTEDMAVERMKGIE